MTTPTYTKRETSRVELNGMLRWLFVKGAHVLTCEIRTYGQHAHDVCVVPHWDVASSVVERFDRAAGAFQRHAEIAASLRQMGWTLIREAAGRSRAAA